MRMSKMSLPCLTLLIAQARGEPQPVTVLPDLTGTWALTDVPNGAEDTVGGDSMLLSLFRHQPVAAAAAAPNSVYAYEIDGDDRGHCWLVPAFDYTSRELLRIELQCDGGERGSVATDGSLSLRINGSTWGRRSPRPATHNATIHTVHMIYMNHYDVGYTGFVNDVDNNYMHNYFPLAASTANEMKTNSSDGGDRFIYTTHAWLMQRFLDCPCPQPPPTPPCVPGLPGVWASGDGLARYHFSAVKSDIKRDNERAEAEDGGQRLSVRCLTTDWETAPPGNCTWSTGACSQTASHISCELDDGKTIVGTVSAAGQNGFDTISFAGASGVASASWHKFTGPLSGLWYGCKRVVNGPNDPHQYLVIGHNDSDDNVSVWWDTNVPPSESSPPRQWTHSTEGFVVVKDNEVRLELQLDGYAANLSGVISPAYDAIQFPSNDESGLWHPHAAQCYPGRDSECPLGEAGPQDCPARTLMNNRTRPVQCPTSAEVRTFEDAIRKGDIVWHAGPFNWQPENMSPQLFEAGIDMVRRMDRRFYGDTNKITTTMSVRDVIYVTRSAVPYLAKHGITGLTIGSNGADKPPEVPKLHRWVDEATGTDVIVAYHPWGYGGYGPTDCAESPNGFALCTEFRSDNTGPPKDTAEVQQSLDKLRSEYPGATVKTSTFDAFIKDVEPARLDLPVVSLEVGDTWMYGSASDPTKMAINRGLQRVWADCLAAGDQECSLENPIIQNFTWFLLKAPEHTWGTAGIDGIWGKDGTFNTTELRNETLLNTDAYAHAAAAWAEQRSFGELAVLSLEEAGHPLAHAARAEVDLIEKVAAPDLTGHTVLPLNSVVKLNGSVEVGFGHDGSIVHLVQAGTNWASPNSPLGAFTYKTLNDSDWMAFTYSYLTNNESQPGFWKPGSNNWTESTIFRPTAGTMLHVNAAKTSVTVQMTMPPRSTERYGSWRTIYLTLSVVDCRGEYCELALTYTTLGKGIVSIGESTSITFQPAPTLKPSNEHSSAWLVDKLGHGVDPEGVQDGGNQFNHAAWGGAIATTAAGAITINCLDAPNVNPMTKTFPIGNPLPASIDEALSKSGKGMARLPKGSVFGMAFNLHNNL